MKLTEKQQLIAILAAAGILVLAEVAFAWSNISSRGEMGTELEALESRDKAAQAKLAQIPHLQRRARELSDICDQYSEILPREDEVSPDAFLDDISSLCREVGLDITSAQPIEVKVESKKNTRRRAPPGAKKVEDKAPKTFVQHKYRFEMEGGFGALHRFVNGVENHTRFLQVDHLSIDNIKGKGSGKKDDIELAQNPRKALTVEVSTYTYSAAPQGEEAKQ